MKYAIPEISWHNRDPVLSVDFQPKRTNGEPSRLATGGTDSHVVIWYISTTDSGSVSLEVASDLTRHQKAVNAVRWSPSGEYLASGDDESIIFVWKQKTEEPVPVEGEEQYKETWVIHKTLRGHMEDVLDISWSANSLQLASGSVDNKLLLWDIGRGKYTNILADHKGFVQGVAWDPLGQLVATASTDRVFRTFDLTSKKVASRSSKACLPFASGHPLHDVTVRLYHDDTLQTYYRRLSFSPDGLLIAVPAGRIEPEQGKMDMKPINAVYIYTRHSLKVPACVLPSGEPALVCRWSPRVYALRTDGPEPAFPAQRRMVLAVGTKRSVLLYDTQQKTPIAMISNIHYTRLTDLTWSPDGRTLVASSTDGFCSVIMFSESELGEVLPESALIPIVEKTPAPEPMEVQEDPQPQKESPKEKDDVKPAKTTPSKPKPEPKNTTPKNKIDSYIKFKAPTEKAKSETSPTKKPKTGKLQKTPVKIDLLVETAMPSWSDNSNSDVLKPKETVKPMEIVEIEDSEDIKLVYEETQPSADDKEQTKDKKESEAKKDESKEKSPKKDEPKQSPERKKMSPKKVSTPTSESSFLKQAKVTDVKQPATTAVASPKAPRRVSFVTLSSPKNKKKC
ncbi:chromatin assembly factor 1 subunit B [Phthorimaea operculella]|nr:chromatin assembly factor 1 subunit B [Phthorimaea operculella]